MKRFIYNKFTLLFLGTIFVILIWFLISLIMDRNGAIFPSPILTFESFVKLLGESYTYKCLLYTLMRMSAGFGLSFALALVVGIIAGNHPNVYQFLKPLMVVIKSIPTVALIFLFVVLVAPKDAPILVVMLICFPILYEAIAGGIANIDKDIINASRVDGATYLKSSLSIKLPLALPYIIVGMVSSFALSFKIVIMAEVITGSTKNGLGSAIRDVQTNDPTNMSTIFAYALIAVIFMLLITLVEEIIKSIMNRRVAFPGLTTNKKDAH